MVALALVTAALWFAETGTFTNPLFKGQDPYITLWKGDYYYSETDGDRIWIRKSASLTGLGRSPRTLVWNSPLRGWDGHANVWAPEVHFVNGQWYIYYAADFASDGRHRLYVLEGGATPLSSYTLGRTGAANGQIVESSGNWAIDPNIFYGADRYLYLTWSCSEDEKGKGAQSLCLARMSDALHTGSDTIRIATPTEGWEQRSGSIEEGPVGIVHEGTTYITYSASASWTTTDYCVGILRNDSGDLLNPLAWSKRGPILDGHGNSFGPGSAVFVPSPDGTEDWCLYHAYDRVDCSPWGCRSIRMRRFNWDADGWPVLGHQEDPGDPIPIPSGDPGL